MDRSYHHSALIGVVRGATTTSDTTTSMGEAMRPRCSLWWVCLAAVVAAAATAGQQAACEVLDSGLQSTFPLPTTLTLRSLTRHWQLDFALMQRQSWSEACVRVEQQRSAVRFMLYRGRCKDGELLDYSFIEGMSVLPHAWTLLMVEVRDNKVLVVPSGAAPVPLRGEMALLPRDELQVAAAQDVEVAVGCRINCPHYNYSSDPGRKKNILKSSQEEAVFYFRPGEDFVRLQYEVTCTTLLGQTIYPHVAYIEPPSKSSRWYIVELLHLRGAAQVSLDYELLRSKDLPSHCTFVSHTIRIEGQGLFSFSCNPVSGKVEWDSGMQYSSSSHACLSTLPVVAGVILSVCLALLS